QAQSTAPARSCQRTKHLMLPEQAGQRVFLGRETLLEFFQCGPLARSRVLITALAKFLEKYTGDVGIPARVARPARQQLLGADRLALAPARPQFFQQFAFEAARSRVVGPRLCRVVRELGSRGKPDA